MSGPDRVIGPGRKSEPLAHDPPSPDQKNLSAYSSEPRGPAVAQRPQGAVPASGNLSEAGSQTTLPPYLIPRSVKSTIAAGATNDAGAAVAGTLRPQRNDGAGQSVTPVLQLMNLLRQPAANQVDEVMRLLKLIEPDQLAIHPDYSAALDSVAQQEPFTVALALARHHPTCAVELGMAATRHGNWNC